MAKYLDPKADVTFKKVFGEHKNLVISLLNALLPLDPGKQVESIEYLPPELVQRTPVDKDASVDVRCEETGGRKFIVEMQLNWRASFKRRVLFNASKAYVMQLPRGDKYESLQPVYSLNLVNDIFEPDIEDYYHYYRMVHYLHSNKVLEGLHLVFVELPKFKSKNLTEKKMQVLWLRFLTEIGEATEEYGWQEVTAKLKELEAKNAKLENAEAERDAATEKLRMTVRNLKTMKLTTEQIPYPNHLTSEQG
ncbi:MAG: Rpn family recombination-promoting nuclease/putative transposase [Kiritimatiellae bacterium]|nr:Rpn family recombination-promoting nuclease/putative transposase [Kiritimatiellia bacterium]